MGTDRARVAGLALASLGLIVASTLVMDWFVVRIIAMQGVPTDLPFDKVVFDLRTIRVCPGGVCASVELSQVPLLSSLGSYATLAPITFWTSLAFAALVAFQCGTRILTDTASATWSRLGYFLGTIFFGLAAGTGYLFTPDIAPLTATRTWAPAMLLAGYALGFVALFFATSQTDRMLEVGSEPLAVGRFGRRVMPTAPVETAPAVGEPAPVVSRTRSRPIPPALRGKLRYTTVTAEITRAGLDAHREAGSARLVLWRDVVGAVARRLPAGEPYAGTPFVDLVSTAGSTLRLLPWTRFSGEPLDGDGDGDARVRALLALVLARCPDAQLDRATRAFLDGSEPPAQLADAAMLAQHDARLA